MNFKNFNIPNKNIPINGWGLEIHSTSLQKNGVVLSGAAPFLFSHRLFTHPTQPGLITSSPNENGIPKWMMQLGEPLRGERNLPLLVSPRCLGVTASHDLSIPTISGNLPNFLVTFIK